jgi:nucleotide-binding universal stress UspA family protein
MSHIKRILVPTDFSGAADLAFGYAIDLAKRYDGSLHVIHVIEDAYFAHGYPDGYFAELPSLQQRMQAEAERHLGVLRTRCTAAEVAATTQVLDGRPAREIVKLAEEMGTDLIVMGTHGRSGVAHLLMGSVAEHVVRTAPCPVFTVRDTARVVDILAAEQRAAKEVPA